MPSWRETVRCVLLCAVAMNACERRVASPDRAPTVPPKPTPVVQAAPDAGAAKAVLALETAPAAYLAKPAVDPTNPDADWHVCARRGAGLRAACKGDDQACSDDVDGKIVDCYRAVYAKRVDTVGDRLWLLGPRFAFESKNAIPEKDGSVSYRQEGEPRYLSPRRFAEAECAKALADVPRKPCIKELLFGVDQLVWMGGFGAGP